MKSSTLAVASLLIIVIVAFGGCATPEPKTSPWPQEKQQAAAPTTADKTDAAANTPDANNLKLLAKNFYKFNKERYEAALGEGKYVFLDFYANWCPICKTEEPKIKAAFNELEARNIVGFRVNYNDDQTDESDKALAKKFGITYQHTKLIIAPNGSVAYRTLEQWNKQDAISAISNTVR